MNNYIISIIVPVYKIPRIILSQCVNSILNQSYENFELILIDDESPDEAGKICDEYALQDKRIKVIHQSNQGVSVARNNGIKSATGKWITFIDADDWVEKDFLSRFLEMAEESDAEILMSACFINYANKEVKNPFFRDTQLVVSGVKKDRIILEYLCSKIHSDNVAFTDIGSPWAKFYKRDFLIRNNLLFNPKLIRMQDNIFNLYAIEKANKIYYKEKFLYHYRKSTISGFSRYTPQIVTYYNLVFKYISEYIQEYNKSDLFKEALKVKQIKSIYVFCKMSLFHPNNPHTLRDKMKELRSIAMSTSYRNAIKNVNMKYLTKTELIWTILLKLKCYLGIYLLFNLKNLIFKLSGKNIK